MRNRVNEKEIPAALLNIYEFCDYLSIGETKANSCDMSPQFIIYLQLSFFRASTGLIESEGINHILPFFIAPSIRSCSHKIATRLEDICHILAISVVVK